MIDVLECALSVQVPLMGALDARADAEARAAIARVLYLCRDAPTHTHCGQRKAES